MSAKNQMMLVDLFMTAFLILSFIRWEGSGAFHFVVGTICLLAFALHIWLHRKWLKATTGALLAGKLSPKLRAKYLVDALLLIVWVAAIVTGILAVVPFLDGVSPSPAGRLHGVSSRLAVPLLLIHIFQHRGQIRSYFKK
ncbi:MAG: hypothetical protein FWE32_07505 [Oscillospiraceae bacterium]|nr:hypothetical protein [Oscillospiraceae bacterium]